MNLLIRNNQKGFNLLGIIIVMSIILIISGIVLFGDDPDKEIGNARDAKRAQDVAAISKAIDLYIQDNDELPADFASTSMAAGEKYVLCDAAASLTCDGQTRECMVIDDANFIGKYLASIPIDPKKTDETDSGYYVTRDSNTSAITIGACETYNNSLDLEILANAKLGTCGDSTCDGQENVSNCAADCDAVCGDALCSVGENANNCAADCPAVCPDTYCTHSETCSTCEADCGACPNQAPTVSDAGRTPINGATNQNYNQRLDWTAWTDPDGDTVEYQTIVYNAFDCTGSVRHTQAWSTSNFYVTSLLYDGRYSWQTKARDQNHQLESSFNTCYNFTVMTDPGGSCPFLYTYDGEKNIFQTDILSSGKMGLPAGEGKRRMPLPDDYYILNSNSLKEVDGIYKLTLTEERGEMNYLDYIKLYYIDHDPDIGVYTDHLGIAQERIDKEIPLYTVDVANLRKPVECSDYNGDDCLAEITELDNVSTAPGDLFQWNHMVVDLGDLSDEKNIKLLIRSYQVVPGTLPDSVVYNREKHGQMPKISFKAEVINKKGEWEAVDTKSLSFSPSEFPRTFVSDISDIFLTDDYRLKLSYFLDARYDYLAIDTSENKPAELKELVLSKADLVNYNQIATKDYSVGPYTLDYDNPKTIYNAMKFSGLFTKYGNVRPLLNKIDDKFVIFQKPDEIEFEFLATPVANNAKRTFLLHSNGYYKVNKYGVLPTVEPMPFHDMSTYPYDISTENYPNEKERKNYIDEWNTRVCEEGKDYCTDLHTGLKILTPKQKEELDIAAYRLTEEMATKEDVKNLKHAKQEYGYEY